MKYVVITGYKHKNGDEFTQCIGVFDNSKEAYGEALLYLNDEITNGGFSEEDNVSISPIYSMEADTGYCMHIVSNSEMFEYAQILFYDDKVDHGRYSKES